MAPAAWCRNGAGCAWNAQGRCFFRHEPHHRGVSLCREVFHDQQSEKLHPEVAKLTAVVCTLRATIARLLGAAAPPPAAVPLPLMAAMVLGRSMWQCGAPFAAAPSEPAAMPYAAPPPPAATAAASLPPRARAATLPSFASPNPFIALSCTDESECEEGQSDINYDGHFHEGTGGALSDVSATDSGDDFVLPDLFGTTPSPSPPSSSCGSPSLSSTRRASPASPTASQAPRASPTTSGPPSRATAAASQVSQAPMASPTSPTSCPPASNAAVKHKGTVESSKPSTTPTGGSPMSFEEWVADNVRDAAECNGPLRRALIPEAIRPYMYKAYLDRFSTP